MYIPPRGDRAGTKAKTDVEVPKIVDMRVLVLLPLVGASSASSFLPASRKLRQKLRQVYELAI